MADATRPLPALRFPAHQAWQALAYCSLATCHMQRAIQVLTCPSVRSPCIQSAKLEMECTCLHFYGASGLCSDQPSRRRVSKGDEFNKAAPAPAAPAAPAPSSRGEWCLPRRRASHASGLGGCRSWRRRSWRGHRAAPGDFYARPPPR